MLLLVFFCVIVAFVGVNAIAVVVGLSRLLIVLLHTQEPAQHTHTRTLLQSHTQFNEEMLQVNDPEIVSKKATAKAKATAQHRTFT